MRKWRSHYKPWQCSLRSMDATGHGCPCMRAHGCSLYLLLPQTPKLVLQDTSTHTPFAWTCCILPIVGHNDRPLRAALVPQASTHTRYQMTRGSQAVTKMDPNHPTCPLLAQSFPVLQRHWQPVSHSLTSHQFLRLHAVLSRLAQAATSANQRRDHRCLWRLCWRWREAVAAEASDCVLHRCCQQSHRRHSNLLKDLALPRHCLHSGPCRWLQRHCQH